MTTRFLADCFFANGEISFEVLTVYVGDTAPLEIDFVTDQGQTMYTHHGVMRYNLHRASIPVRLLQPKPGPNIHLQMKVKLPKHGLSLLSSWAEILTPIAIQEPSIFSLDGASLAQVQIGTSARLSARILGEAENHPCILTLEVHYADGKSMVWQEFSVLVKNGEARYECMVLPQKDETIFSSQVR